MRRGTLVPLWVAIGILAIAGSATAKNSVDDQVKKLGEQGSAGV